MLKLTTFEQFFLNKILNINSENRPLYVCCLIFKSCRDRMERKISNISLLNSLNKLEVCSEVESSSSQFEKIDSEDVKFYEVKDVDEKYTRRTKRRKRKRKNKTKKINISEEPKPKKFRSNFYLLSQPRLHLKYDSKGNPDERSEYNYIPRNIKALSKNLRINEDSNHFIIINVNKTSREDFQEYDFKKPRILKAIKKEL